MGVFGIIATGWRRLFRTPWMLLEPRQARVLGEAEEERHEFDQGEGAKHPPILGRQRHGHSGGHGVQFGGQGIVGELPLDGVGAMHLG